MFKSNLNLDACAEAKVDRADVEVVARKGDH